MLGGSSQPCEASRVLGTLSADGAMEVVTYFASAKLVADRQFSVMVVDWSGLVVGFISGSALSECSHHEGITSLRA
jgi:hypothetical protein